MKRFFFITLLIAFVTIAEAQASFYKEKVEEFNKMRPVDTTDVVMLGDEFTEYAGDWNKLLKWRHVRNRGIAGDDVAGINNRLGQVINGKPKAVFLMVGINDILDGIPIETIINHYVSIIDKIRSASPKTHLYVQSVLPINESYHRADMPLKSSKKISANTSNRLSAKLSGKMNVVASFNRSLRHYCERTHITYINLFRKFVRHGSNELRRELTTDGYSLSPFGYKFWAFELKKYLIEL